MAKSDLIQPQASTSGGGRALRVGLWGVGISVIAAVGCGNVLGLEERELDPTFGAAGSGGAGASGGTGASGGAGGTGGGASALCTEYCDEILANCTGALLQYPNREQCLSICANIPEGSSPSGNTMTCRLEQAINARVSGEPEQHCSAAGPGGADATGLPICGSNCEGYCGLVGNICPDKFATTGACLQECQTLPDLGGFNSGIDKGNSVQCRLWHVSAASQVAFPHCEHAAGAQPCDPGTVGPSGGAGGGGSGGSAGGSAGAGGSSSGGAGTGGSNG